MEQGILNDSDDFTLAHHSMQFSIDISHSHDDDTSQTGPGGKRRRRKKKRRRRQGERKQKGKGRRRARRPNRPVGERASASRALIQNKVYSPMQISRVQEILGGRLGSYLPVSFYHLGNLIPDL